MQALLSIGLADALLLLRRRAGLSQTEVAVRSGITPSAVSRLEGGHAAPGPARVRRLAACLGTSAEEEDWLQALAAHARLLRCTRRERSYWPGSQAVLDALKAALASINQPTERRNTSMQ